MIYIFDDKKNRQEGYRWTNEKFKEYSDIVTPVYIYSEVQEDAKRKKIFSDGNAILFHESFFDADFNRHYKEAIEIRRELEEFAQTNPNFYLVFFSGSKGSRLLNQNIAYLPVSILYQNLEEFLVKSKNGIFNLKYLLYGNKPNIEQDLVEKLNSSNASLLNLGGPINMFNGANILIATTITNNRLPRIVTGADYKMNLNGDSDIDIHNAIKTNLKPAQYDKIFIPLCFGSSMSDFNGLRLAAHIRCTDTINRCTPIYIYSFVKINELINHEYFNVLKTKNIQLIDYSVKAFEEVINLDPELMELPELPQEMSKLKLEVPKDYEDSHSIANEWAIYRWAKALNTDDKAIQKIIEKVNTQLYFKYLNTIYPTTEIPPISADELQLKNSGKPKILFVDDDAEKGWFEIISKLLSDFNSIVQLDYLGDEIKKISQKEIIDKTICKVSEDDIDIVILDFRLHSDDSVAINIQDVTGFKLLQKIKKINPGIQVVIFSATNKVWNLQALQDEGADGFVIKESPENSLNPSFTLTALSEFIKTIDQCLERGFLKGLFNYLEIIKNRLMVVEDVPENPNFNNFLKKIKKQFNVICSSAKSIKINKPITLDVVFLSCYTFLDLFKKYYLEKGDDHRYYLGFRKDELIRYNLIGNDVDEQGPFIPRDYSDKPGVFHVYSGLLKNYFNNQDIYDANTFIKKFHKIRDCRNDYIHGTKQQFRKEDVLLISESLLPITHSISE